MLYYSIFYCTVHQVYEKEQLALPTPDPEFLTWKVKGADTTAPFYVRRRGSDLKRRSRCRVSASCRLFLCITFCGCFPSIRAAKCRVYIQLFVNFEFGSPNHAELYM